MRIEDRIPLLEETLAGWSRELGDDLLGYRHVYRMVLLFRAARLRRGGVRGVAYAHNPHASAD